MADLYSNCTVDDLFNVTTMNSTIRYESTTAYKTNVGLIISLFGIFLSYQFSGRNNSAVKNELLERTAVLRILVLVVIVLTLPILIVLLVLAMCYKLICSVIIKRKDKQFVRFLDSFDVFWNLEGNSVINILGIIESDSAEVLFENMKLKLQKLYCDADETIDKIFYTTKEEYGFYYWTRYNLIDVNEYIEIIELPEKCELGVEGLEDIMTDLANKCLPYDDAGLFKIFITKQKIGNYDNERGEYGIIFRIHHSVGDGVALIQLLCESLADKSDDAVIKTNAANSHNNDNPDDLINMIKKLCNIPMCIVDLALRKSDQNTLHGPALTGLQSFKWTESDDNLLLKVKEIKENVDQFNFSDMMMTALSVGFNNYFSKTLAHVPEDVAVIIPIRFPPQPAMKKNLSILSNDFVISILDLPVQEHRNLDRIKTQLTKFRNSNEFLVNYYFLKLASILPKQILGPMFYSSKATAVFSNLPGPECLTICGGNVLKKLVFFVPHKGISGVGVTALSYGGVLRLAVSADKALVPKSDHLNYILEGMVDEIKRLHLLYVKK